MSEVHALWVVRHSIATAAAADRLVELAGRYGYKDLIVQVRARGDAMYQSALEPQAELLREPTFDPLSHVIATAHKAGLQVHAWLNMLFTWSGTKRPISPDHMVNSHSDWLMVNSSGRAIQAGDYEGIYVCPSRPEVQAHLWRVALDVAQRYPVDGIHMDYIRFPGPEFCYCPACQKAFTLSLIRQANADISLADAMVDGANARWGRAWPDELQYAAAWADFRRQQVSDIVAAVYRSVKRLKPQVTVSAAVFPNWLDAYKARFQDWHGWAKSGLLDLICPMAYSKDTAVVEAQIREAVSESHGRRIWAGLGAWQIQPESVVEKVKAVRAVGADGFALFSYGGITQEVANETYLKSLQARLAALPEPPGELSMLTSEAARPILAYLKEHNAASIATCGPEGPWVAAVFYVHEVHDDFLTLYFLTDPATRHGRDLAGNPQVAATIQEDYHDWRRIKGIQLVGRAELVTGPLELARAWRLYLAKFTFVHDFLGAPGEFLDAYAGKMGKVRFYKLTPAQMWFSDNERHFGKRDVLDCAMGEVVSAKV